MSAEDEKLVAGGGVPQPHRLVVRPRDDARPVRAKRDRCDVGPVPAEDGEALVELRVHGLPLPAPQLGGRLIEPNASGLDLTGLDARLGRDNVGDV